MGKTGQVITESKRRELKDDTQSQQELIENDGGCFNVPKSQEDAPLYSDHTKHQSTYEADRQPRATDPNKDLLATYRQEVDFIFST